MSLEIINTGATLVTCAIVAATAIAALIQLRHLRASNQIEAQMAINSLIQSADFNEAIMRLRDLSAMVEDPAYGWAFARPLSQGLPPEVVAMRRAAKLVGSNLENIGNMVRNGLTDKRLFIEQFGNVVTEAWDLLRPYTCIRRKLSTHDSVWEDFEYLTILSNEWHEKIGSAFPKEMRRLLPPWAQIVLPETVLPKETRAE
ncbi:MAG: hypothetical protein ABR584_09300 [Candidatus Baltobacteraceae bacterium]